MYISLAYRIITTSWNVWCYWSLWYNIPDYSIWEQLFCKRNVHERSTSNRLKTISVFFRSSSSPFVKGGKQDHLLISGCGVPAP